jgi:hypothetical protein
MKLVLQAFTKSIWPAKNLPCEDDLSVPLADVHGMKTLEVQITKNGF